MIEKLYTVEEVAQLASVTGRTIRNYLKSGRLVGRKIGGQWRFPESEVQRLLSGGGVAAEMESREEPDYPMAPEQEPYMPEHTSPPPSFGAETSGTNAAAPLTQPILQPAAPPVFTSGQQSPSVGTAQPVAPAGAQNAQGNAPRRESTPAPAYAPQPTRGAAVPPNPGSTAQTAGVNPVSSPAAIPTAPQQAPGGTGTSNGYQRPAPAGSPGMYNAPAPLPTETNAPPAPGQPAASSYGDFSTSAYTTEPYTETYDYEQPPAAAGMQETEMPGAMAPEHAPPQAQPDNEESTPALSDTGLKVLQFVAEVHDCTAGAQTCSVIEVIHNLPTAQATITQLANLAAQESAQGIPCECYVEYDERFSVARYTLLGSAMYLARALQLIG